MDKNSTVLITGGLGFIGKKLGAYLSETGFSNVHALAGTTEGLDLGDDASLGWAFDINPEVVIHLATRLPSKENCLDYPAGMMYENLFVTTKIMEEARMSGCKKFISVWDSSCYPERQILPYKESDLWEGAPHWTKRYYGNTARVLMELNMAFSTQFEDFIGVNLIFPEVYGPNSRFNPRRNNVIEAVITNVKASQQEGTPLRVNGSSKASRDFLYIDDAISSIYYAINHATEPNTYNVSQGEDISIKRLHEMVVEITGYNKEIEWIEDKLDIKERSFLNIAAIKKDLGWTPKTNIKEGLEKTIAWHDENLSVSFVSPDSILVP
jgi:GDP-L-fucose synthase